MLGVPSLSVVLALAASLTTGLRLQRTYSGYEAKYSRYIFYTGGEYVNYSDDLYTFNAPTKNGSVIRNQMYVEELVPAAGVNKTYPLIMLPGAGTLFGGAGWLNTPDNRTGWASYFLNQGYAVYLLDYPNSGRSSGFPNYFPTPAQLASKNLVAPEKFLPNNYPQAINHTHYPGSGMMGDPIFDSLFARQASLPSNLTALELNTRKALCDLLRRVGPAFLVGTDFGGTFMILAADECPQLIKGMFAVEPTITPFTPGRRAYGLTNTSLLYDPPITSPADLQPTFFLGENSTANNSCTLQGPNPHKLVNVAKVPFGFYTAEASVSNTFTHCIAAYLRQSSVNFDWIRLQDVGIRGNGYLSVIERNNLRIASRVVQPWLEALNTRKTRR